MKKLINDLKHLVNPVYPACGEPAESIKKIKKAKQTSKYQTNPKYFLGALCGICGI